MSNYDSGSVSDALRSATVILPLSAEEVRHPDWVISEAWEKLCDKYFDGESVLSLEYDLYGARRGVDPKWRDRLEGADLTATVLMNSSVESWDVNSVMLNNTEAINRGLAAIPYDADLAADDWMEHAPALAGVLKAFKVRGVSVAKIGKVMCLKRPGLFPMLDELVRQALYNSDYATKAFDTPEEFASIVIKEIGYFRRVLTWPHPTAGTNLAVLRLLADALNAEIARRTGEPFQWLTPVRVLDNLLWFEWGGGKQFGWVEDLAARTMRRKTADV